MAVPNIFATATTTIPLSQLDANFATAITLGNTAIYLGNTTTSIGNLTLTNATISSVSTAVTVAQGGTGLTSGTSGGVPYFSATTTMASSAALAANALVIGGGVGSAPATTTTGTGVLTALGVNTGTAGAFVVNGGALGTPSSGTVTNLTGTASININGTVGATTPNTGAFTTLSATGAATLNNGATISATSGALGIKLIGRAADNVSNLLFYKNDGTTLVGGIANTNSAINVEVGSVVGSFTSAGLSVTGAIDTTGNLLVGTTNSSSTAGVGFKVLPNSNYPQLSMVGSSTTNSATTLEVYSTGAAAYRFYVGYGGTIFATSTTISAISDARYKENIVDLDVGLDAIMSLKPRKFDWKDGKGKNIKGDRGFIAQEFEQVFPDLIDEWKDDVADGEEPYKSVRQDLIPVLVKAIQELNQRLSIVENK